MKISASRSTRRLTVSACALAVLAAAVPSAEAEPVAAELRVQAEQETLAPGQTYLTDTASIATDTRKPACNGSGEAKTVKGPSALGVLIDAAGVKRSLSPLGISDEFDFGLLVCGIGAALASDEAFWLYKVNHVSPEVGADQLKIEAGDEVLWYFSNTATGRNTGDELALRAPVRVKPSTTFEVKVFAYDFAGKRTPAAGAQVVYGQQKVTTDANGVAEVTSGSDRQPLRAVRGCSCLPPPPQRSGSDRLKLRAVRGKDIASKSTEVCVAEELTDCSPVRPSTVNGTADRDSINGSRGPETINAYGGRDRVDARGGGRDVVRCGAGVDRVSIDGKDRAARDCEVVNDTKRTARSASGR